MGVVYAAVHLGGGATVALKTCPSDPAGRCGAARESARRRLEREFRLAAGLRHPNVVRAREWDADRGRGFFTMDRVVGGTNFVSHVRRAGAVDHRRLRAALAGLARALAYLHGRGVVHRDLKPANVPVDAGGAVRVLDFGVAAPAGRRGGAACRGGTPVYMAPERADRNDPRGTDPAVDLYAVGVMTYAALAGRLPFDGPARRAAPASRADHPPPLPIDTPADLAALCGRLLSRNPDARPDAAGLLAAVRPPAGSRG